MLTRFVEKRWYGNPGVLLGLSPLECLVRQVAKARQRKIRKRDVPASVPVIVVGNISVGGTGKTPLIIELVKWLQSKGLTPGVLSKGYGRDSEQTFVINEQHQAIQVGDEPLLIFQQTGCCVAVGNDRSVLASLLAEQGCQVILSDDGMQDVNLHRDYEIVVVDGQRVFGNGHLLPVGPLREPVTRLAKVDALLINGDQAPELEYEITGLIKVVPTELQNLKTGEIGHLDDLTSSRPVYAVAGMGNPEKFYRSLKQLGFDFVTKPFPDHHAFMREDFDQFNPDSCVIMTGKDAVKCRPFAQPNWWVLNIRMQLPNRLLHQLEQTLSYLL